MRECFISNGLVTVGIHLLIRESYVATLKYSLSCLGDGVYSSTIFFLHSRFLNLILGGGVWMRWLERT